MHQRLLTWIKTDLDDDTVIGDPLDPLKEATQPQHFYTGVSVPKGEEISVENHLIPLARQVAANLNDRVNNRFGRLTTDVEEGRTAEIIEEGNLILRYLTIERDETIDHVIDFAVTDEANV